MYDREDGLTRVSVVYLRSSSEMRGVDITLEDGGVELLGIVRDLSGGAVEGAHLVAEHSFARSDSDGRFSMWVRPGPQSVVADADGYASNLVEGVAPGQLFELFLTPEAVLTGQVVRANSGEPISGAMVNAGAQEWGGNHSALTDDGGRFRIEGLEPGVYKPLLESNDARGSAVEQVILGIGETSSPILIKAHVAYSVDGGVFTSDGTNCEDGWVSLFDRASGRRASVSVERGGSVHVPGLLPGTYAVSLGCEGYVSAESYEPITIVDSSHSGLAWKVMRGRAIHGLVVDPRGKPVAGLTVEARQKLDPSRPRAQQTWARDTTTREGRFALRGLLSGQFNLTVSANRATPSDPLTVAVPDDRDVDDIRIELPATGEVRGSVVDERARAIPRTTVSLRGGAKNFTATVVDDGSFRFEHVATGTYQATVHSRWGPLRSLNSPDDAGDTVVVEAGQEIAVKLVVDFATSSISGHVRDADGGAIDDAFVEAVRESEEAAGPAMRDAPWGNFYGQPLLSEADGSFALRGLPAGKYTLRAYRKGGGEGFTAHVPTGTDVVVTIAAVGRLTGVVTVPGGGFPEEFSLEVIDTVNGFRRRDKFFRTGGEWSVPELPAGRYKVRVNMGAATAETESVVRAGEDTTGVKIELVPKISVRGAVTDLEGNPIAGMAVSIRGLGGSASTPVDDARRHVTDTSGRFELTNVPAGDVEVVISPQSPGSGESTRMPLVISGTAPTLELPPIRLPAPALQRP